jgi:hypothetical protein
MAVTLVDSGISRQEIEIAFAVDIPYEGTFAFGKDNGQWMIVMRTVPIFLIDILLSIWSDIHGFWFEIAIESTNLRKKFKKTKHFQRRVIPRHQALAEAVALALCNSRLERQGFRGRAPSHPMLLPLLP